MILTCATSNAGKLREFQRIFDEYARGRFTLRALRGIAPPEETGDSFVENAVLKATYYSQHTSGIVFADDSGLSVDGLDGAPGVHSARFAGPEATDEENNDRLLTLLGDSTERSARFVCTIAAAEQGVLLGTFTDDVEGIIVGEPRGNAGFGYDPLFYFPPLERTFGEASAEEKMLVSHRGKALARLIRWLLERTTIQ